MKQGDKAFIKGTDTQVTVESDEFTYENEQYHFVKTWVGRLDTTHTIAARSLEPIVENAEKQKNS